MEALMKKQKKLEAAIPTRDGVQFLKIGNFVKVAEPWEKNRDSR